PVRQARIGPQGSMGTGASTAIQDLTTIQASTATLASTACRQPVAGRKIFAGLVPVVLVPRVPAVLAVLAVPARQAGPMHRACAAACRADWEMAALTCGNGIAGKMFPCPPMPAFPGERPSRGQNTATGNAFPTRPM